MASIIFNGDRLKALRAAIQLNTSAAIASGSADPTSAAPGISLSPGSLYLSTSTGKLYVKKTSTGNDTNYDVVPQLSATLTANRVVITDSTGAIVTDAQLTYDATTDTLTAVNITASGTVNLSGLTASLPVKTDASKNLVSSQIVNADVDPAAAIEVSKLAALTASRALTSNASGVITPSTVTDTELGYVSGVTSSIQTQISGKVSKAGDSMTGDLVMGGNKVTSVGTPSAGTDAANKSYVDNLISGLYWKNPVRAVSMSDITLSAPQTIDGVSVIAGDRVLVAGQSTGSQNGIYVVAAGAWTRATDLASGSSAAATAVFIQEGTVYADTGWTCTSDAGSDVVGTNSLTFTQFTGAGAITAGVGLSKTGNTLDVNLGAGIVQLPTDEVGIDLLTASGLILTEDGTTPSTGTNAQLAVRLDGSTIARSASGIKVADQGITNTQVSNSAAIAYSKLNLSASIVNADVSATAAIDYSKLNLSGSIVNADVATGAAIAYSKLNLAASIVNADIATGAAIARSKLAAGTGFTFVTNDTSGVMQSTAVTASRAVATDANGLPVASATTATELGFVSGVTSAIQTQLNDKLSLTGGTMSGNIAMGTNKLTGLGAGTTAGDSVRYEQAILVSGVNAFAADQSMGTFKLTNLGTPTAGTDAATKAYVDLGDATGTTNLTLTAGQTISTVANTYTHQVINIQANASGTTVLSSTPFGTGTFKNGQIITLVGNSSTNIVQIDNNDNAKGCIMNASWTGGAYDSITFVYSSTADRFIEVSRNN